MKGCLFLIFLLPAFVWSQPREGYIQEFSKNLEAQKYMECLEVLERWDNEHCMVPGGVCDIIVINAFRSGIFLLQDKFKEGGYSLSEALDLWYECGIIPQIPPPLWNTCDYNKRIEIDLCGKKPLLKPLDS